MKLIHTFLFFTLMMFSASLYAGAAEKWEYDVKPDQNQKLDVKGHQVDKYGNAANDYEYNRKIDPKTVANKTKMGTVGINRLLKITGWGILGNAALQALLESVDWVIDLEAQSIWRNKPKPDEYGCIYKNGGGKPVEFTHNMLEKGYDCPLDAANKLIDIYKVNNPQISDVKFQKWIVPPANPVIKSPTFSYTFKINGADAFEVVTLANQEKQVEPSADREYLKPEDLADYANHTHPDYSNPDLAPKLEPKYNPQIAPDLWKPANPWEYDNSPTVDEVKKELEQAKPEPKDDKIKENEPDPETGGKSFSLPAFCSWATTVCEFMDWMKEKPEKEQEQVQPDINDQGVFKKKFDTSFLLSKQCPPDIPLKLQSQYLTGDFTFSMKWLCIIFTALGYPIVFASHCVGIWILYETVARKEMKW